MTCVYCKGKTKKSTTSYTVDRKGYHLFIEKIPAHVCTQCGEKYFDNKEVKAMEEMIITLEKKIDMVLAA